MTYDHGRFVWFELITKEIERATTFYTEALPWRVETAEMPMGPYHGIKVGDVGVGGLSPPMMEGLPTFWLSFLSVADVEATAKLVVAHGGTMLADAMDIPGVGRIQPMQDPQGAVLSLFKGVDGDPPAAEGPGSFCWNELCVDDVAAATAFYEGVFGFTHEEMPMPQGAYVVLKKDGKSRGGIMAKPAPDMPSFWVQYVEVADCDDAVARVTASGGSVMVGPMDVSEIGRFAVVVDPLGAAIGVVKVAPGSD